MTYFRTLLLISFAWLIVSPANAQVFELSFWPSPSTAKDPRVVQIVEHPCGEVAVARVSVIPPYKKDGVLVPERVLEVNSVGKVIRRWWLPTDFLIRSVSGDVLTIEYESKLYKVRPGGQISLLSLSNFPKELERPTCKVPKELLPSDYAVCEVFKDTKTSLPRRLAYETVCS